MNPLYEHNFLNYDCSYRNRWKQYTVENGSSVIVDRQQALVGSTIELGALLLANDKEVKVGTPLVEGSKVVLTVEEHLKGDKVRVLRSSQKEIYENSGFSSYANSPYSFFHSIVLEYSILFPKSLFVTHSKYSSSSLTSLSE